VVARHDVQRPQREPALQLAVRAAVLCKRLLEQQHPQLAVGGLGKERLPVPAVARKEVVHADPHPRLADDVPEPQRVLASRRDVRLLKQVLQHARELCQAGGGGEQPAVSERTLRDIGRLDAVSHERSAAALHWLQLRPAPPLRVRRRCGAQRLARRWELRVGEGEARQM